MRKLITALLAGLATLTLMIAGPTAAQAQPIYNQFPAWDTTQVVTYPCAILVNKGRCTVPRVTAASYFNTTMISGRAFTHYPTDTWEFDIGPSAGQGIGVMCWLSGGAAGGIWEKVDARFAFPGTSYSASSLWIGYVDDAYVNLSYFDRINAVPHC